MEEDSNHVLPHTHTPAGLWPAVLACSDVCSCCVWSSFEMLAVEVLDFYAAVWFTELLYFCPACRLVWGHMTPHGGVLSYTVTLMLAHHRSALILACIHLLISCTLRAVARLLFCHARLTFVPLMCVSAFKNTFLQRVPGWDQSREILCVLTRVGWEVIRGCSSGWHVRLLILLEVLRGDDADGGEELRPTGVSVVQIG